MCFSFTVLSSLAILYIVSEKSRTIWNCMLGSEITRFKYTSPRLGGGGVPICLYLSQDRGRIYWTNFVNKVCPHGSGLFGHSVYWASYVVCKCWWWLHEAETLIWSTEIVSNWVKSGCYASVFLFCRGLLHWITNAFKHKAHYANLESSINSWNATRRKFVYWTVLKPEINISYMKYPIYMLETVTMQANLFDYTTLNKQEVRRVCCCVP
jgi:hypothetical protein